MNISLLISDKPLKVRLKKIHAEKAELVFGDNQTVTISGKYLPRRVKIGDQFYLNFMSEDDLSKTKKEIAKEVLKEILQ